MELLTIDLDWSQITDNLTRLMTAYILVPIAWNRGHEVRSAGLRTFPLVAVAYCGFMLQGMAVLNTSDAYSWLPRTLRISLAMELLVMGLRANSLIPWALAISSFTR